MAKLSARGRKELARVFKEKKPESNSIIWEKRTLALMSDGTVLIKRDIRFEPDSYEPKGRFHSYGWVIKGKIEAGLTTEDWEQIYLDAGYQRA